MEEAEEMGRLYRKTEQDLERSKQRTQESMNSLERLRQQGINDQRMRDQLDMQERALHQQQFQRCALYTLPNGQLTRVCN